jgi:hypothetical protein
MMLSEGDGDRDWSMNGGILLQLPMPLGRFKFCRLS